MAGDIQKTKSVAITAHRLNATAVSFTNMGGQDAVGLDTIAISGDATGTLDKAVGSTTTVLGVPAAPAHVIATGTFLDGSVQVLLDTNI